MKKFLTLLFFIFHFFPKRLLLLFFGAFFISNCFGQYSSQNITLLSHWDTVLTIAEPSYHVRYSSVWGWANPVDNREYAIIGGSNGTYFVDVTVPTSPVLRDFVPGRRDSCIWREYKTYQHYLYAVSDDAVNAHNQNSMQIIDMSYLPDSVHVAYDCDTLVRRSHTVFIDGNNLYCGGVQLPNHGGPSNMAVLSLANPTAPVLLRKLEQDYPSSYYVHDMFVRNDTCYASCGNYGLFIYKWNANNTLSLKASLTNYLNQGYNHSSALTADGKTLIFTDEVPVNLPAKSLDVSNFGNLTVLQDFKSTPSSTATPHNPFILKGDNSRVVISYYQDGVQIFDISNPSNVVRTGYFDTDTNNCPTCPNPNYSGCWGVYIDLPSGIILSSDMQNGLYVFDPSAALGVTSVSNKLSVDVFPNPSTDDFDLSFSLSSGQKISYELTDMAGKKIMEKQMDVPSGKTTVHLNGKSLNAGAYMLSVKSKSSSFTKKLIKTNK